MSGPLLNSDLSQNYLIFNQHYFWFQTEKQRTKFHRYALFNQMRFMDQDVADYFLMEAYYRFMHS